jgi:hypothetical protein
MTVQAFSGTSVPVAGTTGGAAGGGKVLGARGMTGAGRTVERGTTGAAAVKRRGGEIVGVGGTTGGSRWPLEGVS